MRKIILVVLVAFGVVSCSLDGSEQAEFILAPIQDVTMATSYKVDSISVITVRYKRPDDCHIFNGYYYYPQGMTRTCAVEFVHLTDQSDCMPDDDVYEIPLNFKPAVPGVYLFRFWDGNDADGSQHYFEAEAEVTY